MTARSSGQSKMNHLAKMSDLSAPLYDLILRLFWFRQWREAEFRQMVVDLMDLTGSESVLDVGCGTGTLTSVIAGRMNREGSIFGIDLAPRMIEVARKKAYKQTRQIEFRVASSLALPFNNETFDVVVTSLVYHQFFSREERMKTLSEVWRILRPEGRYVAAEFTRFTPGNLMITHDSLIQKIHLFGPDLLKESGFHILKKVEIAKGITLLATKKVRGADERFAYENLCGRVHRSLLTMTSDTQRKSLTMMDEDYYSYIKKRFRKEASFYSITVDIPSLWLRDKAVSFLNAREGSRILDVATGTGGQAFAFAKKGYDVVGIDLSEDMLKVANKKNKYENLKFKVADATRLPFKNNHFDVSCISLALHDMPLAIREKAVAEMARATKPGGIIAIIDYALPKNKIGRYLIYHLIKSHETKYYPEFIDSDLEALLGKYRINKEKEIPIMFGCAKISKWINEK